AVLVNRCERHAAGTCELGLAQANAVPQLPQPFRECHASPSRATGRRPIVAASATSGNPNRNVAIIIKWLLPSVAIVAIVPSSTTTRFTGCCTRHAPGGHGTFPPSAFRRQGPKINKR